MMSITHAAIALATSTIALGTANPYALLTAGVGSQLPDLDTTESWIGRALYPIAALIEHRFPHRTITHSFISTGFVAIAAAPLALLDWHIWAALTIGQFCGWFSDAFTKSGVAAFWPDTARLVIPGNPKARLSTQSQAEYWVLAIAATLTIISINLVSAGGISEQFKLAFFQDSATAADMFHKHGSSRLIKVDVEGIHAHTSQAIAGRFVVVEATSSDVIAESQETGRLYKIGSAPDVQIRPTKVKAELGQAIKITAQEANLQEIAVNDWLQRLPQNSYISGTLLLDEMGEVRIQTEIEAYPSIKVFGGQLELSNARPAQLAVLREFWIVQGKAIVKVRQ